MDIKDRYLNNPHITLDEKRKRQLGILQEYGEEVSGPTVIVRPHLPIRHEVVMSQEENDLG